MDLFTNAEDSHVDVLYEISGRLGTADGFREVLTRVVEFATALVQCNSCLIYVLEGVCAGRAAGKQTNQRV
jgi:hypothetical protein